MSTHAGFLRGINLGPRRRGGGAHRPIPVEGMGLGAVATITGRRNEVFAAGEEGAAGLEGRIERGLAKSLGFEVAVFVRTAAEVRAIAAHDPFDPAEVEASQGKLQVALLRDRPAATVRKEVLALASDEDRLAFGERELYWLPSGGIRDSALNFKAIEQRVGATTMRTKGTVEELARKWFGK